MKFMKFHQSGPGSSLHLSETSYLRIFYNPAGGRSSAALSQAPAPAPRPPVAPGLSAKEESPAAAGLPWSPPSRLASLPRGRGGVMSSGLRLAQHKQVPCLKRSSDLGCAAAEQCNYKTVHMLSKHVI